MKKVKMTSSVGSRKRGRNYEVTDRYAETLVNNNFAVLVEKKKEEKVETETKELKTKPKTKAKPITKIG